MLKYGLLLIFYLGLNTGYTQQSELIINKVKYYVEKYDSLNVRVVSVPANKIDSLTQEELIFIIDGEMLLRVKSFKKGLNNCTQLVNKERDFFSEINTALNPKIIIDESNKFSFEMGLRGPEKSNYMIGSCICDSDLFIKATYATTSEEAYNKVKKDYSKIFNDKND